jgi:hypothetical protein
MMNYKETKRRIKEHEGIQLAWIIMLLGLAYMTITVVSFIIAGLVTLFALAIHVVFGIPPMMTVTFIVSVMFILLLNKKSRDS